VEGGKKVAIDYNPLFPEKTDLIQPLALYFEEIWGKWTK
jgi:hypothetical protein